MYLYIYLYLRIVQRAVAFRGDDGTGWKGATSPVKMAGARYTYLSFYLYLYLRVKPGKGATSLVKRKGGGSLVKMAAGKVNTSIFLFLYLYIFVYVKE